MKNKDTENLINKISKEIEPADLDAAKQANDRVHEAYGSGNRGLVHAQTVSKLEDLF